jgi:hypothetical protein
MIPPKAISQANFVETIEQITLLGYKNGDTVFYRAFTGNDDKFPKNMRSPFPEVPTELKTLNENGLNIYLVVNGGGQKDVGVTEGKAIFYEHDDIPKQDQILLWQKFGLPEPTFQVDTGGKSIHSYWVFDRSIGVAEWKILQRDLLNHTNADRKNKNPSRVMRLAGFKHQKTGERSTIISRSGHVYSFDVLRSAIPVEPPKIQAKQAPKPKAKQPESSLVPLENCLAKSNRELLGGVGKGGRNDAGAKLARDLIGTENYLIEIGHPYTGSARELFDRFAAGCCPPIEDNEAETIWKSAEGDRPTPSCQFEGVDNVLAAWNAKHGHSASGQALDPELSQNINDALNLKNGKAPNLFGGELGKLLSIAAGNFNIPVSILQFCLLPILGSQIKSETDLMINPGTDYKVRAIRWCALVGETGTKKSPIIDILTGAMSSIQREVADRYKAEKLEYDAAFRAWKATKPADRDEEPTPVTPMMDLYFSDFTIESISASISNHPGNGYLVHNDELAGFFKSMDAYRKNGGGDRQKWLTLYNGSALKVNRKSSDTIFIPQTSVSIVGGIQPTTIEHLISGDESQEDGLWNRFTFTRLPQTRIEAFSSTPQSLTEHLEKLYRTLASQESFRHTLSEESKPMWAEWHGWTEDKTFSESSWIARGTYAKIEGIAARNALIIHRTLAAIAGVSPPIEISASTMAIAIEWTKWELSQTLLEYQMLGLTNDPEQARILKFIDKFTGKGWVSARDVTHWWSGREKPNTSGIKSFMAKVVKLGQAIDNDEPIDSSKYRIQISSNGSNSSNKSPENNAQSQESLLLPLVTKNSQQNPEPAQSIVTNFVTTANNKVSNKIDATGNGIPIDDFQKTVTKTVDNGSNKPEPTANGHHSDSTENFVTKPSNSINSMNINGFSDSVTTVTTVPNKNNLKIGDRVQMGGDIITVEKIEGNIVCGRTDDDSYIGGSIDSVTLVINEGVEYEC